MSDSPPLDAVLFDMDGVVTDTASVHAEAWKRMFDDFLRAQADRTGGTFQPFELVSDYRTYVDGKPRYDGVRSFLQSRGIELPWGSDDDPPEEETVCGLGNSKQVYFQTWLKENRAPVYPGTLALIEALHREGVKTALFTSSRNADAVLANAGLERLFEVRVDGNELARLRVSGKPDPAMLLEAASRLGATPQRTAVFEDAISGVEAGRRGGFACVVGIAREGPEVDLRNAGADLVVSDAAELRVEARRLERKTVANLPSVWDHEATIRNRLSGRRPIIFLAFDGTLTPIVDDHRKALISDKMRFAVERLSRLCKVVIVSGRDLDMLQRMVGLDRVFLVGRHGFEIFAPDGSLEGLEIGTELLPEVDGVEAKLKTKLADIPGHSVERKRLSVTVHYRNVAEADIGTVGAFVEKVPSGHPRMARGLGKKVYELQPRFDWNKGRAVAWLLERLAPDPSQVLPVYVGGDTTDEHAFRQLAGHGLTVVVRDEVPRRTAADYALAETGEVGRFLTMLAEIAAETAREER